MKKIVRILTIVLFLCISVQQGHAAVNIAGNGDWGNFTGSLTYNPISTASAQI